MFGNTGHGSRQMRILAISKYTALAPQLSSAGGSSWIEGGGIVHGLKSDLNSYRCELGGLLGIGIGTACLKHLLPARRHFMLTACDNLEALQTITVARTKVKSSWKSVDFISHVLDVWSQQHCQPSPQHVYGHQDDKGMVPLTFVEHLNSAWTSWRKH